MNFIRLRRLSLDFTKASEALRGWGMGEGDDLGVDHVVIFPLIALSYCMTGHTERIHRYIGTFC